jgi:hypothetical protein
MTRRSRWAAWIVGAIVVGIGLDAPASSAAPAIVGGKLEPAAAKLPSSAKGGSAQVTAMNVDSGAYGDADTVGRDGRYSLKLPPGKWALRTSVVAEGRPYASFLSAAIVTKPGQKRTLPLTLKKFKKPRKRRKGRHKHPRKRPPAARNSKINPRDGRPYPGVAYAFKDFDITSAIAALGVLRRGMPDMLLTDLAASTSCPFTLVEWARRAGVEQEIALQQTEYFDPDARVEPGHLIDPEVFIRGRIEDRPGSPPRHAIIVWLEDAKTGARLSGDVSVVTIGEGFFGAEQRLAKLIIRDLICARRPSQAVAGPPAPPPPPKPVANVYEGTFSGMAESMNGSLQYQWSGSGRFDAAQDFSTAPPGAPAGEYRLFTQSSGKVHMTLTGTAAQCSVNGSKDFDLPEGPGGYIWVQLDTDQPSYLINLIYLLSSIQANLSGGMECSGSLPFAAFGILAETKKAHTSPTTTLDDSESHTAGEGSGFDYTTSWSLSPR